LSTTPPIDCRVDVSFCAVLGEHRKPRIGQSVRPWSGVLSLR
jgi:hypothetical protein